MELEGFPGEGGSALGSSRRGGTQTTKAKALLGRKTSNVSTMVRGSDQELMERGCVCTHTHVHKCECVHPGGGLQGL